MVRFLFASSIALGAASLAHAQAPLSDVEIIVTGTRAPGGVNADTYGGAVTRFTRADLETRQTRVVSDILRDASGVSVARSGGPGSQTQVRLRGAEANHTLVLIDGIEASDPFQGEFDFAGLIADEGARVEVLRGAQSALYGSDAIGGVIAYITPSGAEQTGISGRVEAGSHSTQSIAARVGGVVRALDYALSAGFYETDGTNIARDGDEDDAARNRAVSGKLRYAVSDALSLRAVGRYASTRADTDPQPADLVIDDPAPFFSQQARYALLGADLALLNGRLRNTLEVQIADVERRNHDTFAFFFDGKREKASYIGSFALTDAPFAQGLTLALDWERETYRNVPVDFVGPQNAKRTLETKGVVAVYDARYRDIAGLSAAVRFDSNGRFDDTTTWRVHGSWRLPTATRVTAAFGTGVKNPTNFELYGFDSTSFSGNPSLKPEKSTGWEFGLEQAMLENALTIGAAYLEAELEDEIFTQFGGPPAFLASPANRSTISQRSGVESFARLRFATVTVDAAYTWLDSTENGVDEVRRPEQSGSATLAWRDPSERGGAFLTLRYNGEAVDDVFSFPVSRTTLKAYALVNFGGDVRLSETASLFVRVENALDEDYEDVFSYRAPVRTGTVGMKASF